MHLSLSVNDSGCSAIAFCLSVWIPAGWMKMKQQKALCSCCISFILNSDRLTQVLTCLSTSSHSYFIVQKHCILFTVTEVSSTDGWAEMLWNRPLMSRPFYLVGFNRFAQAWFPWRCWQCLVYSGRALIWGVMLHVNSWSQVCAIH